MKKAFIILTIFWAVINANVQTIHDWENPNVLGVNKLPYHSTLQLPSKQNEFNEIIGVLS